MASRMLVASSGRMLSMYRIVLRVVYRVAITTFLYALASVFEQGGFLCGFWCMCENGRRTMLNVAISTFGGVVL